MCVCVCGPSATHTSSDTSMEHEERVVEHFVVAVKKDDGKRTFMKRLRMSIYRSE